MGYRNYLGIIKKEDFKKIDTDFIEYIKDEYGYCSIEDILEEAGAIEIQELGKWSKEGSHLEYKNTEVPKELLTSFQVIKKYINGQGCGFNLLTPRDLLFVIRSYRMRTHKYLKKLLNEDKYDERSTEEKCISYVKDKLDWWKYSANTRQDLKYTINDNWSFEYDMFNLLHNYKMIDWNEYLLIIWGW